ncbi:hypothetical protein BRC81_05090 [Halobacteriales archaeon QS_1_68_20]|nr:MAG: hypothetical protein BRC81_05090 [Halobacteriales archaeon QS_1_68_20]
MSREDEALGDRSPDTPAAAFEVRAPLLSTEDLATVLRRDVVADDLLDRVARGYLYGSFADPASTVDEGRLSDVDVWLDVEGLAEGAVSTRFGGSGFGLRNRLEAMGDLRVYDGSERDERLLEIDLQPEDPAVRETLRRAERTAFRTSEADRDAPRSRPLDLSLATPEMTEAILDGPRLPLW